VCMLGLPWSLYIGSKSKQIYLTRRGGTNRNRKRNKGGGARAGRLGVLAGWRGGELGEAVAGWRWAGAAWGGWAAVSWAAAAWAGAAWDGAGLAAGRSAGWAVRPDRTFFFIFSSSEFEIYF
jgi:hypothetical protein